MVSGFIASIQGHIIASKFVVLARVRYSPGMDDSLIPFWIITERERTVAAAHCMGCTAGIAESCSHIASVLSDLEARTKINGKLFCTQVKCSWLLPTYVKQVEYGRIRDINFTSARKVKSDLDAKIDSLPNVSSPENSTNRNVANKIPAPTKPEMEAFFTFVQDRSC